MKEKVVTVKVFKAVSPSELEAQLQQWLDTNPTIVIRFVSQSQDGMGWVTVTLFYERK
jgi:hypothetical protein